MPTAWAIDSGRAGNSRAYEEEPRPLGRPAKVWRLTSAADRRAVFQAVLGDAVAVTRTEHILAGARRCAYRVSPRGG